jgi:hypothetical protein
MHVFTYFIQMRSSIHTCASLSDTRLQRNTKILGVLAPVDLVDGAHLLALASLDANGFARTGVDVWVFNHLHYVLGGCQMMILFHAASQLFIELSSPLLVLLLSVRIVLLL